MGGCLHIGGVTCDNCRPTGWRAPQPGVANPIAPVVTPLYPVLDPAPRSQRCPVCDGRRVVPADFYPDDPPGLPGETREVDAKYRTCLTCEGKGVIQYG